MTQEELNELFDGQKGDRLGEEIADRILKDFSLLHTVAEALEHETEHIRKAAAKALRKVSEHAPAKVYPFFERIEKLLDSEDFDTRSNAMATIANLSEVDEDKRITEKIWQRIASFVTETGAETANKAIEALGKIAEHTTEFRSKIAARLMEYEKLGKDTIDHNEKVQKAMETIERLKEKFDADLFKDIEVELKKNIGSAMDATAEVASSLWNRVRSWANTDDDKPADQTQPKTDALEPPPADTK